MTFTKRILLGLSAGLVAGVVGGELVAPLKVAADGFVRLLQMMVLPYVTISIISSLGTLTISQARLLAMRGGIVLLAIWSIVLAFARLMPLAFPPAATASFFSTTLIEPPPAFDLLDLYIPANPFNALANNIVPAVVLFSVIIGVALIGVERKQVLLDVLQVAGSVVARATRAVTQLTPYGLFAIVAVAAGTLTIDQIQRVQVFLVTYVILALIVALWVLPGLIAALTGIRVRDLFGRTRDSLIVATVAGDLFIVLPGLIDACKELLARHPDVSADATGMPDVIVPASFNFPHAGKLLSLSFIPFAAWFSDATLSAADYSQLFLAGVLSFFGSLNSAVPFLLDLFRLPADAFQLFLATGIVNARFGTLLAAMHTVTLAILGSLALTGGLRWSPRRLARFAVATAVLLTVVLGGLRTLFGTVLHREFAGADLVYSMQPRLDGEPARLLDAIPTESRTQVDALEAIRGRGTLRVAVLPDRLPFAFQNGERRLVGFDVEMAQVLAADLGAHAEFVQVEYDELPDLLSRGVLDVAMSGIPVTPERASTLVFSEPYLDETFAFVTRDHLRDRFRTWDAIRALGTVRVAAPDLPMYRRVLRTRAPHLELVPLRRTDELFRDDDVVAYVMPAERGSVITLLNPLYSVVVPGPDPIKLPVAYPLARNDGRWTTFINTWLELKRRDGTLDALYQHWILGRTAAPPTPRWSIARNVLHWLD